MERFRVLIVIALLLVSPTVTSSNGNESVMHPNIVRTINEAGDDSEIELTPSSLEGVEVKKEQLAQTLEMVSPIEVEYKPSASDEITVSPDIERKGGKDGYTNV